MNNVFDIGAVSRQLRTSGEPPDNGGMDARITKLESIVPTLATKIDMADMRTELVRVEGSIRTDMHKEFTAQTWRIIGAMLSFGTLLSAAVFFIARNVK